jgi:hypothetical protein
LIFCDFFLDCMPLVLKKGKTAFPVLCIRHSGFMPACPFFSGESPIA